MPTATAKKSKDAPTGAEFTALRKYLKDNGAFTDTHLFLSVGASISGRSRHAIARSLAIYLKEGHPK